MKRLARDERGAAMVLALILLLVSGLVAAPLLSYTGTGLLTGEVYETRTAELYAADAGVGDAVWKIQHPEEAGYLPCSPGSPPRSYNITDVNGKGVDVDIWSVYAVSNMTFIYRVLSTAIGDESETHIEAYINGVNKYGDYGGLLEHILTSPGEIDVANKVILEYPEGAEPYPEYPDDWPQPAELEEFYGDQVEDGTHYYSDTVIDILGIDTELGPLFVDGTLDIVNSSNTPATVTLVGTVYATGDTGVGTTGKDITLDLGGETLFVSSDTVGNQKALIIGGQCTVKGPGVLAAVGDIEFKPKSQVGEEQGAGPVFIVSVIGTTTVQPSGHVYGAIAGGIEVYVQQGEKPVITYPTAGFDSYDLNFLIGIQELAYGILSWEATQQ